MEHSVISGHVINTEKTTAKEEVKSPSHLKESANKFLRIITFIDLPIRKKFLLFSFGVLFWFIVMFVISIAANIDVNKKTGKIVNQLVPMDRAVQKITRKLQSLSTDSAEIAAIGNTFLFEQKLAVSRERLEDIKDFISALHAGGQIADINRDNNELIESFSIAPAAELIKVDTFTSALQQLVERAEAKLSEISESKLSMLENSSEGKSGLTLKLNEYRQILITAISGSNDFSAKLSGLYTAYSGQIEHTTEFTFYTFIAVLLLATLLLVIFTISISDSIVVPVRSIIDQIRALGAGRVDVSNQVVVKSKDEIGALSADFNTLTREIHDIVTFKKVIEEDHELQDVYRRLGKAFNKKCGLDEFTIYEVSNNQNKMKPVYPVMLNDKEIYCNEEILTNCELCKVKKTGHTISSLSYDEICREFKPEIDKAYLCIPMIVGGKTGGVVQFRLDNREDAIESNYKKLFKAEQYIKESLSVIDAKRLTDTLRESALKDPLTGLYNRRFLQEYTETLVSGVLRREKTVGLIMCDLDYFKQVNDTHGHNVGDSVLRETSNLILKCVRSADLVIRFGGEEFLVLLLDINEGETMSVAEKIRGTFENARIKIPDGVISKTISLGVSEFPSDAKTFWQAIKFADVALYKAKESGRNRALRFTEEMWSGQEF